MLYLRHTHSVCVIPTMLSQSWIFAATIIATLLLHICSLVKSFPEADKVQSLPGQPNVSFQQFAGYVTVDDNEERALFYYFVEAEKDPASKPLVLWLNGGPGCTSVGIGAFTENGPFVTIYGEAITKNNYSWNKEANILYLESPAGVGFSYSVNKSFYATLNDKITAQDNLVFLQGWLNKFPEYKNRDFFITGESYAGHYVPQLAELVLSSKVNINLKGIAIGNPLLDYDSDFNAQDEYYWTHGIISDSAYKIRTSLCNASRFFREMYISGQISSDCVSAMKQTSNEYSYIQAIDRYYVIGDKCLSYSLAQAKFLSYDLIASRFPQFFKSPNPQQTNLELDQQIDVCNMKYAEMYLNRKDVQKALHARLVGNITYKLCSTVTLTEYYEVLDRLIPTINTVGSLVRSGLQVTVYSGDQDSVIPFSSSRRLVDGLAMKLGLQTSVPYRAWFVEKQVGGWTQVYGNQLTYATIRGASHTAPTTQPQRSFVLFKAFLEGKQLPKA